MATVAVRAAFRIGGDSITGLRSAAAAPPGVPRSRWRSESALSHMATTSAARCAGPHIAMELQRFARLSVGCRRSIPAQRSSVLCSPSLCQYRDLERLHDKLNTLKARYNNSGAMKRVKRVLMAESDKDQIARYVQKLEDSFRHFTVHEFRYSLYVTDSFPELGHESHCSPDATHAR